MPESVQKSDVRSKVHLEVRSKVRKEVRTAVCIYSNHRHAQFSNLLSCTKKKNVILVFTYAFSLSNTHAFNNLDRFNNKVPTGAHYLKANQFHIQVHARDQTQFVLRHITPTHSRSAHSRAGLFKGGITLSNG